MNQSTVQAQSYYFENIIFGEGIVPHYGYYSENYGDAIVPDNQNGYISYYNCSFIKGAAVIIRVDSNANEIWRHNVRSNRVVDIRSLIVDNQGNINLFGIYEGGLKTDASPTTNLLPQSGFFRLKMDMNGNVISTQRLRDPSNLLLVSAVMDAAGNSYVVTPLQGTLDMDPDTSVYNVSSVVRTSVVQKFDPQGHLIWAKPFVVDSTASYGPMVTDVLINPQNELYVLGRFNDSTDFDLDTASSTYLHAPNISNFVVKMDNNGSFQWVQKFEYGSLTPQFEGATLDDNGDLYLSGMFSDTIDANPEAGYVPLISQGGADFYLLKLNANGQFLWAKSAGGAGADAAIDLFYHEGNIIYLGRYTDTTDVALGAAVYMATIEDSILGNIIIHEGHFFQTIDTAGNYITTQLLKGYVYPRKIRIEPSGSVYLTGAYDGADFDPSDAVVFFDDGIGGEDYFFLKLSRDSCKAFDIEAHYSNYLLCQDTGIARVEPIYGLAPYQYLWSSGTTDSLFLYDTLNIASVTVTDARGCTEERTFYLEGPRDSANTIGVDVEPYLHSGYARLRPGQISRFTMEGINHYCTPADGVIYLVLDSLLSYNGSGPTPPDSIIGDTLFWNFSNLIYDNPLLLSFDILVDSSIIFGRTLYYDVGMLTSSADLDTSNNFKQYVGIVANSYDPNMKLAYPEGACAGKLVEKGEKLTYTILFQNTGTARAFNIKIIDTLPAGLDLYTLDIVSASHDFNLSPIVNNTLVFNFDNINLIDSATNEPASHGYITFDIRADQTIVGDFSVDNRVGIYFDLNPPIITNTVTRTFTNSIPTFDTAISLVNNLLVANETQANYQWVDCDNNNIWLSGATGQSYAPIQNGRYAVLLEQKTCTALSSCFDYTWIGTNTTEQSSKIRVYPNPTNSILYLDADPNLHPTNVQFYDAWGRLVLETESTASNIDIGALAAGIYYLSYFNGEQLEQVKIIKTN